jgi:hypothetical protein
MLSLYVNSTKIEEEVDDELRDGHGELIVSGDRSTEARFDNIRTYPAHARSEAPRRSQQR